MVRFFVFLLLLVTTSLATHSILFVSLPFYGDVRPLYKVAHALADLGYDVTFSLPNDYQYWIVHPNITFLGVGQCTMTRTEIEDWLEVMTKADYFDTVDIVMKTFKILSTQQTLFLANYYRTHKIPDLVVWADISIGSLDLVEFLNVSHIQFAPAQLAEPMNNALLSHRPETSYITTLGIGLDPNMDFWKRAWNWFASTGITVMERIDSTLWRNQIRKEMGLEPLSFFKSINKYPVSVIVANIFGHLLPRPLAPFVNLVGPLLPPRPTEKIEPELEEWIEGHDKIIVATLGTVSRFSKTQMANMARGFSKVGIPIVWITRKLTHKNIPFSELSDKVKVVEWTTQFALLSHPKVIAFMTVGGIGGLQEGLWAGLPALCIPSHFEQRENCILLQNSGAGLWLSKLDFTADQITESLQRLIAEPQFREKAKFLSKLMKSSGGLEKAIQIIQTALDFGDSDHLLPHSTKLNWIQHNSLDVLLFFCLIILLVLWVSYRVSYKLIGFCCGKMVHQK